MTEMIALLAIAAVLLLAACAAAAERALFRWKMRPRGECVEHDEPPTLTLSDSGVRARLRSWRERERLA